MYASWLLIKRVVQIYDYIHVRSPVIYRLRFASRCANKSKDLSRNGIQVFICVYIYEIAAMEGIIGSVADQDDAP